MIILGIETSCDETAASVIEGRGDKIKVLSNVVSSQIEIHKKYGGVVPEVAAREHVLNILPVVNEALEEAGINPPQSPLVRGEGKKIDAMAVTVGPGLVTSLLAGVETAKTLAYAWQLPVVAVNHIEGHIYANWLKPIRVISNFQFPISKRIQNAKCLMQNEIKLPALILTVSGGHTMLVLMSGHGKYKLLGETRDDAAGEAFDKAAQLLGVGYPGGPAIAAEAAKLQITNLTSPTSPLQGGQINPFYKGGQRGLNLPRPMIYSNDFDFSFSGLKTALLYGLQKDKDWKNRIPEYAAEFQAAVTEVLVFKTIKAAKALNCKTVMLAGGVAANLELRSRLEAAVKKNLPQAKFIMPELKYCTDNAAMIAAAGYFRAQRKDFTPWQKLKTQANLELK